MSAADSLILADVVELLGGGVTSSHPLCPGAQITLQGFDFGAPQPQTEVVASLLLDGERPSGRRASNRTISLPIQIRGPSRPIMDGARELLQQLIDADTWQLRWTPDPGTGTALPLVFDCFRGTAVVNRDLVMEDQLVSQLTLSFPALPYGRSDTLTTLVFPTPAVSWPQPPTPVRVDDYSTVSTSTQATLWSQSTQHVNDSFSAHWSWAASDHQSGPLYTHTLAAPVSITGLSNLTFQFGLGTSNYSTWHTGNVTFAITLSDNSGHTLSFGGAAYCIASNAPLVPTWTQVTFAIPTSSVFDYAHVASYSIKAWRYTRIISFGTVALVLDSDAYLNGLTATASAVNPIAAVRGTLYSLGAPGGTARAPMSTQFQGPPLTVPQTATFSTAGPFTWTPPAGVTNVKVRVKGATGKGGDRTTAGAGGGAGGGAGIGEDSYPVTPGQTLSGTVGAAGASGGFPTLVASYFDHEDAWNYNTLTTPSFTPAAGELIVVKALNSERSQTFGTPTGGGLTFTNRVDQNVTSHCRADIWTATVGASPSAMTVSLTVATSQQNHAFVVERWSGAKLAGSPATINATGSGAPSANITTAANNSVISWVDGDFDQGTGARTYRGTPTEEQYWPAGDCTGYFAYQTQATAGTVTVGLTAPSQTWTMAGIEIQAFNTGALTDGGYSTFDLLSAAGGASVPANTATGGTGGAAPITNLRPFLTGQSTGFEGGIGTWVNGGNAALSLTSAQAHTGTSSMQMSSVASGTMTASMSGGAAALMMPVVPSGWATVTAWFRSAVSVRTCQVLINWYDSTGAYISTGSGATGSDSTSAWTQLTSALQAPAGAAYADALAQVQSTGGAAEVHYVDDAQLYFGATWAGGNGATGSTTGGGAGSSAGDDAAGVAGSGQTGGTAPTGGISGGNGGAAGGNNAGSVPGGGAFSTGGSASGATGSAGKVVITYTPPLNPFKVLLAHAPSYTAPATLSPMIPVGAGLDTPNGSTEYAVPSPVPGLNARYAGTYTVLAVANVVNTPANSRTVTVTFKQYDYTGGPSTSLAVARTLTPSAESPPIANGMIVIGEISLPVRDIASDNTAAFTTVTVNSTNTSDRFLDVLVLDVRGQLAVINVSSGNGHVNYYLDEPSIDRDMGRVLASDYDRPQATSVLDMVMALSGGPLVVDPAGPGWLLAYSPDAGAPGLTATFYPRWRDSRLS